MVFIVHYILLLCLIFLKNLRGNIIFDRLENEIRLRHGDKIFNITLDNADDNSELDCSMVGRDKNSRRGGRVRWNECYGYTFASIERVKYQYYLMYNRSKNEYEFLRNDELPVIDKSGCATMDADGNVTIEHVTHESARGLLTTRRFVNLYFVTDNLRRSYLNNDKNLLQSSTINIASLTKDVYTSFKSQDYPITVTVDGIMHLPDTEKPYPWEEQTEPAIILAIFDQFAIAQKIKKPGRVVILLTGTILSGNVIGIAYMSTACRGGVGVVESLYNDYAVAKTVAHEAGHTLGIRHINNYVRGSSLGTPESVMDCSKQYTSVMSPYILGTNYTWDSCSIEWFKLFNEGYPYGCTGGTCTFPSDMVPGCMLPTFSECGNTMLDPNEECDCGSEEECDDPCCDAKTCKLKGVCSPMMHECCTDQCTVQSSAKKCRESVDDTCDVPDYCNGVDRQCPKDKVNNYLSCTALDFTKKEKIPGKCYGGKCLSHEIQCRNVRPAYGYNIVSACIRGINGTAACKKLFCQPETNSFCTVVYTPTLEYVKDGTPCGDNMACFSQVCVPITTLPPVSKQDPIGSPVSKPTTKRPTTHGPTSKAPTKLQPLTKRPTTKNPTTKSPTKPDPLTKRPTTNNPTTKKPTRLDPLTKRPTSKSPTSNTPTNRPWYCGDAFRKMYPKVNCNRN